MRQNIVIANRFNGKYPLLEMAWSNIAGKYQDYFLEESVGIWALFERICVWFDCDPDEKLKMYSSYVHELKAMHSEYLKMREYSGKSINSEWNIERLNKEYPFILILSILFSINRFEIYKYFREMTCKYVWTGTKCLEIGTGSGIDSLFLSDKFNLETYDTNPISRKCLEALNIIDNVNYYQTEFSFKKENYYDYIVMTELLEHVEDPVKLLKGAAASIKNNGYIFVTFAMRTPQIDHIYHYMDLQQVKNQIEESGLNVRDEFIAVNTMMSLDEEQKMKAINSFKIPINYCCVLRKI